MAGSYPDVPGYRFAFDVDGTTMISHTASPATLTGTQLANLNNETPSNAWTFSSGFIFSIHFPEPRSVTGILLNRAATHNPMLLQWSSDTTNGQDGTWATALTSYAGIATLNKNDFRSQIQAMNVTSCTALRFNTLTGSFSSTNMYNLHLYGAIDPASSPNRLRIIDMSNVDIAAQLDFGNIPQRNTATKQFKILNNSASQTANNITVTLSAPTDATPSIVGQFQVSTDNVAYANAVNIGNLAPGASTTLYVKDTVASNAQLGAWTARIVAHPTSWT